LLRVELGRGFDYYIDPASISVGADGVVRYSVVARSMGGATNVSYEGLRCNSRERILYAFGRADGSWSPARKLEWQSAAGGTAKYFSTLADYYFCPNRKPVADAAEAVDALKQGGHSALAPKPY
jgi:hypothetical protein